MEHLYLVIFSIIQPAINQSLASYLEAGYFWARDVLTESGVRSLNAQGESSLREPKTAGFLVKLLTFSFLSSSQLQRELRDTLKGSHMGFRLFLITCRNSRTHKVLKGPSTALCTKHLVVYTYEGEHGIWSQSAVQGLAVGTNPGKQHGVYTK